MFRLISVPIPIPIHLECVSLHSYQRLYDETIRRRDAAEVGMAAATSRANFIKGVEEVTEAIRDYENGLKDLYDEGLQNGDLMARQFYEATAEADKTLHEWRRDYVLMQRIRLSIWETIRDQDQSDVDESSSRVPRNPPDTYNPSNGIRAAVYARYKANAGDLLWCHLVGWVSAQRVRVVRLVPKSLPNSELAYLFGFHADVDAELDPRNGITLCRPIAKALKQGHIVICPIEVPPEGRPIAYKCVLVTREMADIFAFGSKKWKDIDGQRLKFRQDNRPAPRYLYFRFLMTYLQHKKQGTSEWVTEIDAQDTVWKTPGPLLRKSFLLKVAVKVSDRPLLESFYETMTFEDLETQQDAEEESMAQKLVESMDVESENAATWPESLESDEE